MSHYLRIPILFVILFCTTTDFFAQSVWSLRAGPTLAMQRWNGINNNSPLIAYHAAIGVESLNPGVPFALFAELGYHQRGMHARIQSYQDQNGINYPGFSINNRFHNLGLALGGRKNFGSTDQFYYLLALRGEYTLGFDLSYEYTGYSDFVRRFNYGLDFGGGMQFPIGIHMGFVQILFQPDVSRQIQSLRYTGYDYLGNPVIFPEQRVFNYSFELSAGIRIFGNAELEDIQE